MSGNPNEFNDDKPKGDWPPAPPGTTKGNGSDPPAWAKTAIIAATGLGVFLLGAVIVKKRSGQSDDQIKDDLKRAAGNTGSAAGKAARQGAEKAQETGKDLWGLGSKKAAQVQEDFPGNAQKLADDIKTAGWEGGKDIKRGAKAAASKVQGLWEEEAKPNYGFLGWRRVVPGVGPTYGR